MLGAVRAVEIDIFNLVTYILNKQFQRNFGNTRNRADAGILGKQGIQRAVQIQTVGKETVQTPRFLNSGQEVIFELIAQHIDDKFVDITAAEIQCKRGVFIRLRVSDTECGDRSGIVNIHGFILRGHFAGKACIIKRDNAQIARVA